MAEGAQQATCFEPYNAAPPLTLRRAPKAVVSKDEARTAFIRTVRQERTSRFPATFR